MVLDVYHKRAHVLKAWFSAVSNTERWLDHKDINVIKGLIYWWVLQDIWSRYVWKCIYILLQLPNAPGLV